MMRFQYEKPASPERNVILSLCIFMAIVCLFYYSIESLSANTDARQEESLQSAIQSAITHCYAVEGFYPESLDYLIENYGVSYDPDKYFVTYQVTGSNLIPNVTISAKQVR